MTTIITSQDYIDDSIVAAKSAAADYVVTLSRAIEVDGETYRVVVDGHHSLAAAARDGVEPEYVDVDDQTALEHDHVVETRGAEGLLEILHMGYDYRDAITGALVW